MLCLNELLLIEAYVKNAFAGFIIMDEDSKIIVSTPMADEILSAPLLGRNLNDFISKDTPSPHGTKMALAKSTPPSDAYVTGICVEGNPVDLYTYARFSFEFEGTWYQGGFFSKVEPLQAAT